MDLNDFETRTKASAGVRMQLSSLRGKKETGVFITVLGIDSDQFAEASADRARTLSAAMEGGNKVTPEVLVKAKAALLASLTVGWENVTKDGEPVPFSKKTAEEVYLAYPAIREQVDEFVVERANFAGT